MKLYNRVYFTITFIALFLPLSSYSYLTLECLLQVQPSVFQSKRYLSPLVGALVYESGLLLELYQQSTTTTPKPTTATGKLLYYFFHKDKEQFAPTVARNNPPTYISPEDCGTLLSCLEKDNFNDQLVTLYTKLASKAQLTYPAEHNKTAFKKHFNNIVKYLQESHKECMAGLYPLYTPHALLSAFLYCKATKLEEIKAYAQALELEWPQETIINSTNSNSLQTSYSFDYTFEDKEHSNYQKLCIALIAQRTYLTSLPLLIPQGYYSYQNGKVVPDCFETVLREFCNLLVYDSTTCRFDVEQFLGHCSLNSEFYNYYTQVQSSPLEVKSNAAGHYWFNCVSGKPNVEYVSGNYEIRPTISNFVTVLNYLLGSQAATLQDLCLFLSTTTRKISCKTKKQEVYGNYKGLHQTTADILEFLVEDRLKHYSIKISLIPFEHIWHAWIQVPERAAPTSWIKNSEALKSLESFLDTNASISIEGHALHKLIGS